MSDYIRYPTNNSILLFSTFSAFPSVALNGTFAAALDTDILYVYSTGSNSWVVIGGPGSALTIGTIDSQTAAANGAVITGSSLVMQSASATRPGLVNITTQSFAGNKTFTGTIAASNLSGTNTGDVTLAAFGSAPSANGASLSGQTLTLQPADSTHPGGLSIGTQSIAGAKTLLSALNMNSQLINAVSDPVSAQDAATKNYVDSVASGLNPIQAAYAATTASLTGTYSNGVAGVGATFTITATGAFTLDGTTPPITSRILIKDQSSGFQNGVYNLTLPGSIGVSPILTRALDFNTPTSINAGDLIPVINGTVNTKTSWLQTATITTVGTDSLVFVQWSYNPSTIVTTVGSIDGQTASANGLVISGNSIYAQSASATVPGLVNTTTQTLAGAKTFSSTITGNLSGNATTATNATNVAITDDATTNAAMYPLWVTTPSSNQAAKVSSTKLTFNPSLGAMTLPVVISGVSIVNISSSTTLTANCVHLVATTAAWSLTLPAPVTGRSIWIKDSTGGANNFNITIVRSASEKINGLAASYVFAAAWGSIHLVSDGTDWFSI